LYHTTPFGHTGKEFFVVTAKDGKPCKRCGTTEWNNQGLCRQCVRGYEQKRRHTHREKRLEFNRRWREENPEKAKRAYDRWVSANKERVLEYAREWRRNNPEVMAALKSRYRTKKTAAGGSFTAQEWKDLCNYYENKCLCCGRDDVKLAADHVLPVSKGGSSNIDNIQPLCKSCNSSKFDKHIDYRNRGGIMRWIQKKLL
jgi:5-methylcytosine-specific restriction endonuclease McrA